MMKNAEIRRKRLSELWFHLDKKGVSTLQNAISYKTLIRPLVWADWRRNGGKLGYEGLARKYGITKSQARTICGKYVPC